jgi:LysR family transcriptional repressor of citA
MEPILKEYHSRYPSIAVMTKTAHSPEVIQLLLDNIIQIAMVNLPPALPNFEVIPFYEDDIVLIGNPVHPLSIVGAIDVDELSTLPLVYVDWGPPFHDWVMANVPRSYLPKLQVDKAELAINFVKAGIAVSLMPRSIIAQELADGTLSEISINRTTLPKRSAYVILHPDKKNRLGVEKWLQLMAESGYSVV